MKSIFRNIAWVIILLFVASCANIVTPTGGDKDITPPKVLKTIPGNRSLNFAGNSARIYFDEYVSLHDVFGQVVVSPYTKEKPELKLTGKTLSVRFNDSLISNTTYTISFGDAIKDITEGNILRDFEYTFSTGNNFDSSFIAGSVVNAYSHLPEKGVYVMLYNIDEDSIPYKTTPLYISKTDASGLFKLNNLRQGKYKIFALKDMDSDLLFSQPSEEIAYVETPVNTEVQYTTGKDTLVKTNEIKLFLFTEKPSTQKLLKSYTSEFGKVVLVFRLPVNKLLINPISSGFTSENYLQEYSGKRDTLNLWIRNYEKDSLMLQVKDNGFDADTVVLTLKKKQSSFKGRGETALKKLRLTTPVVNSEYDYYKKFRIQTSAPIDKYDFSKIILTESWDTVKPIFVFTDTIKRNILMQYDWKEDVAYTFLALPEAFQDIYGNSNDTLKLSFKSTKSQKYGNIEFKISRQESEENASFIIQLLNDKDNIVDFQIVNLSGTASFKNINPGTYKARVIFDRNRNGEWDTGNYLKKNQPEKVYYYPSELNVKANWDQQIEWHIIN